MNWFLVLSVSQSSVSPVAVLVQPPVCETGPTHSNVSKSNDIEASQLESGIKDDNDMEESNELEEKEIDKDDDNGDDDLHSVEEV